MNKLAAFLRDYSFASFFIPFGIIMAVFGILSFGSVQRTKNFPQTEGTVSRMELFEEGYSDRNGYHEATYIVYVKYILDGKEYEGDYGIFPEMKIGETVKLAYNPADPTDITQPHGILLPIALTAGGAAVLAGGIVSIIRTRNKRKALKAQEEDWIYGEQ